MMKKLIDYNINTPEYWDEIYKDEIIKNKERIALNRFQKIINLITDGSDVLDVGCGKGEFIKYLIDNKQHCQIKGVDFSDIAIKHCKKILPTCEFYAHDVSFISSIFEKQFDYVVALEFLEHLEEPAEFINQIPKILKKNGWLILALPYKNKVSGGAEHLYSYDFYDILDLFKKPYWHVVALTRYHKAFVNMCVLVKLT